MTVHWPVLPPDDIPGVLAKLPTILEGRREHGILILSRWSEWLGGANFAHDDSARDERVARQQLKRLRTLTEKLDALLADSNDRTQHLLAVTLDPEGRKPIIPGEGYRRLEAIRSTVHALAVAVPRSELMIVRRVPGKPRTSAGPLFVQEASEVYEYLTGERAERRVERDPPHADCGPFYDFCKAIWQSRCGNVVGLGNSLKRWAKFRNADDTSSRVIAQLAHLYPEWGLFTRP